MNITEANNLKLGDRVIVTKDDLKFIAHVTAKDNDNLVFMEYIENKEKKDMRTFFAEANPRTGIVKLK